MSRQLLVESIRIDGRTQSRKRVNEDAVAEYAEAMKAGANLPPVTVFFDGKEFWMADGFHRLLAAQRIGRKNIAADVKQGARVDAARRTRRTGCAGPMRTSGTRWKWR